MAAVTRRCNWADLFEVERSSPPLFASSSWAAAAAAILFFSPLRLDRAILPVLGPSFRSPVASGLVGAAFRLRGAIDPRSVGRSSRILSC